MQKLLSVHMHVPVRLHITFMLITMWFLSFWIHCFRNYINVFMLGAARKRVVIKRLLLSLCG